MYPWCDGSAGSASPIDAATSRLGSLVADSATTVNSTCPGRNMLSPSSRSTSSQWGGKIELTRTRLKLARWASRNAISKLVSFSLCRPTPLVRKALVGMNILASINLELPPFVPYRGPQLYRRLSVATPVHRPLHHLRQHLSGTERDFLDFDLRLAALLAAHDEHVFRRVDTQSPITCFSCHDCRAPFFAFSFDGVEHVDGLNLRRRYLRFDRRRELRPPWPLTRS